MKKLTFIFLLIGSQANAQNTWFKELSGFLALGTYINNDTIVTFSPDSKDNRIIITSNYNDLKTGNSLYTETLDYAILSGDTNINNQLRSAKSFIFDEKNNNSKIAFSFGDTIGSINRYMWKAGIFQVNPFKKMDYNLTIDTFNTFINQYYKFNNIEYAIRSWHVPVDRLNIIGNYDILRLSDSGKVKIVKRQLNPTPCASCHWLDFEKLHADNQNSNNLFLEINDQWDWHGVPGSFQMDVVKMDTNGNTIWKCRPNNRDSINTSGFQMLQKPNGNIICCWNDYYHPPHKHPSFDYNIEENNDNSTIWFAEIDYQTGNVLWRKNIRRYLFTKFTTKEELDRRGQDVFFNEAQLVNNNSIVWVGQRAGTFPYPTGWKYLPVILKTDLFGNPIWYREIDISQGDTSDRGMRVYSFTQSVDKYLVLSGEHMSDIGSDYSHKASLLKLDTLGCLKPGCELSGCTNPAAYNYDKSATKDNGSCIVNTCPKMQEFIFVNNSERYDSGGVFRNEIIYKVTGMRDNKVYLNKSIFKMTHLSRLESDGSKLYWNALDTLCVPDNGQCYEVELFMPEKENYTDVSVRMTYILNFFNRKYQYVVNLKNRYAYFYFKNGEFVSSPCVNDTLPTPPIIPIVDCEFKVFPNPASTKLNINCNGNTFDPMEMSLYNAVGQLIHQQTIKHDKNILNIENFSRGLYFVQLKNLKSKVIQTHKVIFY